MLSVFPELLFLAPFSALALRMACAGFLIFSAWRTWENEDGATRVLSVAEVVVAAVLIGGAWTQPAALGVVFIAATWLAYPRMSVYPRSTALLLLVIGATLLITGPGAFAFDLPL